MTDQPTLVDATPGAHSFLDALAVISFKLACGCSIRAGEPSKAIHHKRAGSEYDCSKHGDQVITRATQRLVGWKK